MIGGIKLQGVVKNTYAPVAPKTQDAFQSTLASASASPPAGLNVETASNAAKSALNRPTMPKLDAAYYESKSKLTSDEYRAESKRQADAISAAQGLPSGQYDFTHMTCGQLHTVTENMVGNLGFTIDQVQKLSDLWSCQDSTGGVLNAKPNDDTEYRNFTQELTSDRDANLSTRDSINTTLGDLALAAVKRLTKINETSTADQLYLRVLEAS